MNTKDVLVVSNLLHEHGFNPTQARIALDLTSGSHLRLNDFKRKEIFKYGGRFFDGCYESCVVHFLKTNPTGGDFYVWLQKSGYEIKIEKV